MFVVTEVLQTQKEVEVTRTHKQEGSGQFSLPGAMCLQVRSTGRTGAGLGVEQEDHVTRQVTVPAYGHLPSQSPVLSPDPPFRARARAT